MESVTWLQILTYVFIALIITVYMIRLARYARMPVHLRWELYPLAGERNRPWGGSYLEEPEWWSKPREEKGFLNEVKFMGEEVLFFKEYRRLNRPYWYYVYPFHIGAFCFLGFVALLIVGALTALGGIEVSASSTNLWGQILYYATPVAGGITFVFGTFGSLGLLVRRLTNKDLRPYTRRIEYINMVLILALFLTGLVSWAIYDSAFALGREYVRGMFTLSPVSGIAPLMVAHFLLVLVTAAYMPFTNMMHFFAKWFTYHKIRWDDAPNLRGSGLENRLGALLNQPLTWSSPHAQDLQRWSDIAHELTGRELTPRVKKGVTE